MRLAIIIITSLLTLTSYGQTLKKLKVQCTDKFDTRASITVESYSQDPVMASSALTNSLAMNGFKVISYRTAQEKIQINNKGSKTDTTFNQEITVGKATYLKSVYVVTFTYSSRADLNCSGVVISNISGQIVDLANDGEIVATFSFTQNSFQGKCASTIMDALATSLKQKGKK